ncbi:MAG: SDR family NAD(P)-dependent oxidoreductase, partial [Candidatus Limnocylindrales bacterium]
MNTNAADRSPIGTEDPRTSGDQPPFPEQRQSPPGLEAEMEPAPDYGESSYEGHGRLSGKVALITGADSGIGRAVALAYAREGADIVVSYLEEQEDARVTCDIVEEAGRRFIDDVTGDPGVLLLLQVRDHDVGTLAGADSGIGRAGA